MPSDATNCAIGRGAASAERVDEQNDFRAGSRPAITSRTTVVPMSDRANAKHARPREQQNHREQNRDVLADGEQRERVEHVRDRRDRRGIRARRRAAPRRPPVKFTASRIGSVANAAVSSTTPVIATAHQGIRRRQETGSAAASVRGARAVERGKPV